MADATQRSTVEAYLFARRRPASDAELAATFSGWPMRAILREIDEDLRGRGVHLARSAGGWCLRTRPDASDLAGHFAEPAPRLSRAAMEVLAVVAAFQTSEPVTRGEIERVRGVQLSPGLFDALFEAGYIRPGRRRETPGRPLTWVTTSRFLEAFDVDDVGELAQVQAMREGGLLDLPAAPRGIAGLGEDPSA